MDDPASISIRGNITSGKSCKTQAFKKRVRLDQLPSAAMSSGVPRQNMPSSGTAASLALNAFRVSVERSRVRELASDPRSSTSTSRRLSRGASLGRNLNMSAKVAAATSPRGSVSDAAGVAVAALRGRQEGPPSARVSSVARMFSSRFSAVPVQFGVTDFMQSIINASPGCYIDDDGSNDILERYNFFAHGRRFLVRCVHEAPRVLQYTC